jgi:hypothetical protein
VHQIFSSTRSYKDLQSYITQALLALHYLLTYQDVDDLAGVLNLQTEHALPNPPLDLISH